MSKVYAFLEVNIIRMACSKESHELFFAFFMLALDENGIIFEDVLIQ
jgi:hypothetical protein